MFSLTVRLSNTLIINNFRKFLKKDLVNLTSVGLKQFEYVQPGRDEGVTFADKSIWTDSHINN